MDGASPHPTPARPLGSYNATPSTADGAVKERVGAKRRRRDEDEEEDARLREEEAEEEEKEGDAAVDEGADMEERAGYGAEGDIESAAEVDGEADGGCRRRGQAADSQQPPQQSSAAQPQRGGPAVARGTVNLPEVSTWKVKAKGGLVEVSDGRAWLEDIGEEGAVQTNAETGGIYQIASSFFSSSSESSRSCMSASLSACSNLCATLSTSALGRPKRSKGLNSSSGFPSRQKVYT